ncbi:hypothetical protein PFICI_06090 [Pestalotiopsis fici W106-1]|uniref:C3H1-type domain-containing protein n=1 Tax=Pestalotiopsis fici (strain W106-1 / CGMCC3.15140) TaxID=1229662 RepID=W3X4M9_PESFW|nr:uncharacterized protein PFICI_06090 [Pestalotiopsis fici W106-1]ETS81088.1 hypothetical protein PFICI_06090 [Pestalotiopsis fici W106-1]
MAQGGHSWPGGQFHPNGMEHSGAIDPNAGNLTYGSGLGSDTEMLYMDDWNTMNQNPANFGGQPHAAPTGQQFYHAPQSYYQNTNAFSDSNRQIDQRTSSPALAYGSSLYHEPAYQRPAPQQQEQPQHPPAQQQSYQQFNTDLGQRNASASTNNFPDGSWQPQTNHGGQNQYAQQALAYENPQNMYQQHLQQPSHAHTPTPPPAQRGTGQYPLSHGGPVNSRPNVVTPPASNIQAHAPPQHLHPGPSEYHFQPNQGQASQVTYQNAPVHSGPMAPAYASQVQFAQPPQSNGHASNAPATSQSLGQQQVYAAQHSAGVSKAPVTRTISPMSSGQHVSAPSPVPYISNISAPPAQSHMTIQQQSTHNPATFTVIPSRPPFDPLSHGGFSQLDGESNLFLSEAPVEIEWTDFVPDDSFSFSAHFNANDGPLMPNRQKRLPCEIRRDWKWLRKQEKSAQNDAQRRAILLEKDRLDREMVAVSGERIEPTTKVGVKKIGSKSGSRPTSAPKTGSDSSDDSSDYDSDSEFEESEEDQAARKIKASGRPSDPVKAIEYDVVMAVWHAPEEEAQPNSTANSIQAFGAHIEKLWTKIKDLKKEVKAAKEKKSKKLESLEVEVGKQMKLMLTAIEAVTKFAEPSVLENMGGNSKLAVILWNAFRNSLSAKDFNGPLPKAILSLMSHFTTMERSLVLGVLKVPEYHKKHQKDFDKTCLGFLDQIQSKAKGTAADTEKKAKELSTSETKEPLSAPKKNPVFMAKDLVSASKKVVSSESKKVQPTGPAVLDARKSSNVVTKSVGSSPSKRPRDEEADSRAAKKVAVDGTSGTSVTKPSSTTTTKTTTVVQPRAKSTGSLLPGRTARPAVKPATKKVESQQSSSSLSTISGLLAEIAKPKSPPRQKEEPTKAPETEEERKRRLRKESRRGLRVMWKPDHELEQVRIFQHDAAEDEGRASNMVRDARDNRSEGQALKRALSHVEDQDGDAEKEDDEEGANEGNPKETNLRPWLDPPAVDFMHIDQVNPGQRDKTFVTRGGATTFHTEEQQAMEKYEQTQFMEIYTSVSDIPETPKSPTRKEVEKPSVLPHVSQLPADTPNLQELHLRWTEIAQFGAEQATQRMLQRLRNKSTPERAAKFDRLLADLRNSSMMSQDRNQPYAFAPSASQQAYSSKLAAMTPAERDAEVLRLLKSDAVLNWVDKHPVDPNNLQTAQRHDYGDAKVQADVDAVEAVVTTFLGKPYPVTEPPEHLRSNAAYVKEWQTGYDKDMADRSSHDATARAKKLAEEFARVSAASVPQTAPVPATTQATQDPNAAAWAAYFTQMAPAQQQQAQSAQGQQLTYDQYAAILQQTQALQAQQGGPGAQAPGLQYPQQPQPAQQDPNGHIGALLAALGGQANQSQPAVAAQAAQQDPNAAAWAAYYASMGQAQQPPAAAAAAAQPQQQQQQHQPQQQHAYQHRDRDRDRSNRNYNGADAMLDYGPSEADSRDKAHRGGRKENSKDTFRGGKDYDRKGINRSLIGTKPCTFWAQGKCAKGDQCTFRHDPNDLK